MTFSAVGAPPQVNNVASTSPKSWDAPSDSFTLKTTKDTFIESVTKGLNSGQLSPDVNRLAEAILSPGKPGLPKVQVKTFAVDGMQAKDIMFIERVPPVPEGPNIVLFIPDKAGNSFLSFNTVEDMNAGLKKLADDPQWLEAFSEHFAVEGLPAKKKRVIDTMTEFKKNTINAIVGPYATERVDIFARLDKEASAPPAAVNGLTNLKEESIGPDGSVTYSGQQADGTKVFYEYDAYGNFQGADNKGNSYFVKNGINSHMPLKPLTTREFEIRVYEEAEKNVGADDIRGLYEELLVHLEHPFSGIGDALKALGVNKDTADTVERYLDNPFSALLLDLNKNNQIGKVFGVDKATMDSALKGAGDIAQGFVPFYGQARGLGSLLAKAIRNEPLTKQETRDMADMLALKPNSPARKNLSEPQSPNRPAIENKPTVPEPTPNETHEPPASSDTESAPTPNAETGPNRLRPSQWSDIRHFSIAEGEQLIEGVTPNAKGIYQIKGPNGEDRWMIRITDDAGTSQVHEIDGRFKLSNGYAQIIDPLTRKPVITVHATADGGWSPINGPGGINLPWFLKNAARAKKELNEHIANINKPKEAYTESEREHFSQSLEDLISGSKAEHSQALEKYTEGGSAEINSELRAKSDPNEYSEELKKLLSDLDNQADYRGPAFRYSYVSAEGAKKLKAGVGKVFRGPAIQSSSSQPSNVKGWSTWAKDDPLTQNNQPVIYIFNESIPKKNLSSGFLVDHVAIKPNVSLEVLATKEKDGILYVYFDAPTKVPTERYNLYDGSVARPF